ncbi:MAG: HDOD domain-containing protein [Spirochaetaceae bacterium]|jgi:HD-like signal output (HDOD) protein|nr:HDOD domain-containing protein [Spirochaetaceae bacterium]
MCEELEKDVKKYIKNMPSFSITAAKVLNICNNPQSSPSDLNRVVSLDPVLSARVFRLISSAYDGLARPVTNLVRATIMLGINTVKNMALSTAIPVKPAADNPPALDMDEFWRHSLCTGLAAKLIAKKRRVENPLLEEYFTAGLLHDIGKIPAGALKADGFLEAMELAGQERIDLYQAEERVLKFDHCAVGKIIVDTWRLEGAVGDVIKYHHSCPEYKGPYRDILYTVALANRFSSVMEIGFSGDRYPGPPAPGVLKYLALGEDIFEEIGPVVKKEIEEASLFLKP